MPAFSLAITRSSMRNVLLAAGSIALASMFNPVAAQTPVPEKKPAVQKPVPEKKAVESQSEPEKALASGEKPGPTLIAVSAGPDEITHVVKKGDTLWDLAKEYLKDPFRWPDVFRRNTDIVENPHWIYPGETIRIPSSEVKPDVLARITTKPAPPSDRTVFTNQAMGVVADRIGTNGEVIGRGSFSGVSPGEVEAAPFGDRTGGPPGSGKLAAAYDRPGIKAPAGDRSFQIKDRIFVELPASSSARPGDVLVSYRLGPEISDVSQIVIPTGILRVMSTQPGQPALARIERQFGEIFLDQSVMALNDLQPTVGKPVLVPAGPAEKVVYIAGNPVLPSLQSYVVLTSRAANGVRVGDQFTLIDESVDPRFPAPPVPAAIAEVVRVTPFGVTAIVVDQEQPRIRMGMTARLSARAP